MGMIPEVKCRRCGESFSSLRSRCPNCGTRRVTQSGRTPSATPGTVKGTAAYERAETNTKWQMIFGLILVVSVILAVIVMVTTSLNSTGGTGGSVNVPTATVDAMPTIDAAPTPPPTPTPAVEKVDILYANDPKTEFTMRMGEAPVKLTARVLPLTIQNATVTWSSSDESVLTVTPTEDGGCECTIVGTLETGNVKVTAECFGMEAVCLVYCKE